MRKRNPDSNKYSYGHLLIVGGSAGMSGAAVLASRAALRAGAGLVSVAAPAKAAEIIEASTAEVMVLKVAGSRNSTISSRAAAAIKDFIRKRKINTVVLGNGMGRSKSLLQLCRYFLQTPLPVVIDADGLNNLSRDIKALKKKKCMLVMTPHKGEFMRLIGRPAGFRMSLEEGKRLAQRFALEYNLVLVLKSHRTVVTDGRKLFENKIGNAGMATAGTGDVLAGIIGAFIAQGLDIFSAAKYGVYIHSLAGDLAAKEKGEISLIASDIIDYLPQAVKLES